MADHEVATKAPESDVAPAVNVPGDTPAQGGASLGVRGHNNLKGFWSITDFQFRSIV
jgi:hypothetical protein